MRFRMGVLALCVGFAAGCGEASVATDGAGEGVTLSVEGAGGGENAGAGSFTMSLVARDGEEILLVRRDDGRSAAVRIADGASQALSVEDAQARFAELAPAIDTANEQEKVHLAAPGFELKVSGQEGGDNARISLGMNGQTIDIDATDGGPDGDQALIRVDGADEKAVREFIEDREKLSAEAKAQIYQQLGL